LKGSIPPREHCQGRRFCSHKKLEFFGDPRVSLGTFGFHREPSGFIGNLRVSLGTFGFHWEPSGFIGNLRVSSGTFGFHREPSGSRCRMVPSRPGGGREPPALSRKWNRASRAAVVDGAGRRGGAGVVAPDALGCACTRSPARRTAPRAIVCCNWRAYSSISGPQNIELLREMASSFRNDGIKTRAPRS